MITNGIDQYFYKKFDKTSDKGKELKIVYAGNLGDGQGIEHIIPEAANKLKGVASFKIIGSGGKKNTLAQILLKLNCTNVELKEPIKRDQLIKEYASADVLFLHLNDFPAFEKVLPSKIFEYAASGKTIVAGVSGCSRNFA